MTIAPTKQILMSDMFTNSNTVDKRRIKVDSSSSAYEEGRRFRSFYNFTDASFPAVLKFEITKDIDLIEAVQTIYDGSLSYKVIAGGTESGVFTEVFQINSNRKSSAPVVADSGLTISTGGSLDLTGAIVIDEAYIKVSGSSNNSATVSSGASLIRGFPATTAYVVLDRISGGNSDPAGVLKYEWEVN